MRLWTIQPLAVWEEVQKKGFYICVPEKVENITDGCFTNAYDWLVEEMEKRIENRPDGVSYPVWAWHTYDWKHKKLDLRKSGYSKKGEKCVCLELEIPDDKVVLSDFNRWHDVLNERYSDCSMNEDEWEKELEWYDKLSRTEKGRVMKESWKRIFDVTPFENGWIERGRFIQATFWMLNLNEVKHVRFFTAR